MRPSSTICPWCITITRSHNWAATRKSWVMNNTLIWRSASHVVRSEHENWVGKGDVTVVVEEGFETVTSAEETTDLPLELRLTKPAPAPLETTPSD